MKKQTCLFDLSPEPAEDDSLRPDGRRKTKPLARKNDPKTSHVAAAKVQTDLEDRYVFALGWLFELGCESTSYEIEEAARSHFKGFGRDLNTGRIQKRCGEMKRLGLIAVTDSRFSRHVDSNLGKSSEVEVFQLTKKGESAISKHPQDQWWMHGFNQKDAEKRLNEVSE